MSHSSPDSQKDNNPHRKTVGKWLAKNFVWRIPVYQRHYAWDAEDESGQIHLFWETVMEQTQIRLEGKKMPPQHYLGAVLVDNQTDPEAPPDDIKIYDVVDGQQRLTTIQIALLALIKVADELHCGSDIKKDLEKYVFSNKDQNEPRLHPTNFDNKKFKSVLFDAYEVVPKLTIQNPYNEKADMSKIDTTYLFLQSKYSSFVRKNTEYDAKNVIDAIKKTLTEGFDLVLIVLQKTDDAQRIFESLNNSAKPLTTFDLIRNNVFDRANKDGENVEEMYYSDIWQQLENPYWEKKSDNSKVDPRTHIEAYIARMLVAKIKKEFRFNRNEIFHTYKMDFRTRHLSIDAEIEDLISYSGIYQCLDGAERANGNVTVGKDNFTSADFSVFLHNTWNNRDFYPVIFSILDNDASKEDKCRMLKLLESYVIRRGVCALTAGHYNKYAVSICAKMNGKPSYNALNQMLKSADTETTIFPDNDRVMHGCTNEKFYKSPFQRYVLNQIENSMYDSKDERNSVDETQLTVDHILPQGWEKNTDWKKMVLNNADSSHEALVALYINTIGNLTIMSGKRNSAKSNHSFNKVKELLAKSPLRLNSTLAKEDEWNVEKIRQRSKKLAERICKIWPYDIPE